LPVNISIPEFTGGEMPKQKTHRGAAKRFQLTGSGKIKRSKANKSHLMTGKPAKRTRRLRKGGTVDATQEKTVKKLLPYG
jgi:large subunit ribosomal protein L35